MEQVKMAKLKLKQNNGIHDDERDQRVKQLRDIGLTYKQIGNLFYPPMTRQGVFLISKRLKERESKNKADTEVPAL